MGVWPNSDPVIMTGNVAFDLKRSKFEQRLKGHILQPQPYCASLSPSSSACAWEAAWKIPAQDEGQQWGLACANTQQMAVLKSFGDVTLSFAHILVYIIYRAHGSISKSAIATKARCQNWDAVPLQV